MKQAFMKTAIRRSFALAAATVFGATSLTACQTPPAAPAPEQILEAEQQAVEAVAAKDLPATVIVLSESGPEGSGWIYDDKGHAITANHVASGKGGKITVTFLDGSKHDARVVYENTGEEVDMTVLEIPDAKGKPFIKFADPSTVKAGAIAIELGNGFGEGLGVTKGIVSAWPRVIEGEKASVIQYDTPTNPGNSGGPVVNFRGELIGMCEAIEAHPMPLMTRRGGTAMAQNSGVSYAIPVQRLIDNLSAPLRPDYLPPTPAAPAQAKIN